MAMEKVKQENVDSDNGPDTASVYERAKPEKESGMGRLDNNKFAPEPSKDKMEEAVKNKQNLRQINAEDVVNGRHGRPADGASIHSD